MIGGIRFNPWLKKSYSKLSYLTPGNVKTEQACGRLRSELRKTFSKELIWTEF